MNHEFLRMQKLSGVITEGEYNQKIEELNSAESSTETLNENVVGVGSVLNPYPTKKEEVYEAAFNKFLTEEKEEMEEGVHSDEKEMEEAHCYEEPVEETVNEDERTDAEEEGYKDGFKDAIKDALDTLEKVKKELKKGERDKGDEVSQAEEEGYQDGFADAIKDADDAIAKLRKELKEIDLTEEETEKEKEEGDMRDDGGEDAETRETERMKDMGRD